VAKKTTKAAPEAYDWKKDWYLHDPEDWVMLVTALLGFANLLPNIDFGKPFDYAWPIIITAVFLYKLGKRKKPE